MCFTIEERHWWNVKTCQLVIVHTKPKKYANPSHNFLLWPVFMVYLLGRVQDSQLCWCCRHTCTASLHGWPLVRYQLKSLKLLVMPIFVFKQFFPSTFNCLCIVRKHVAQTFCSIITLADSQTFYQRFVFDSETHTLHTWKYDISMKSPVAKNI